MGMKHCGKTTLGRMLAEREGRVFIDLDGYAEALVSRQRGCPLTLREIYRDEGREAFQALEAESLACLMADYPEDGRRAVLALGGGTIENPEALAAFTGSCLFIYLEEDEDVLFRRIQASGIPPFLAGDDPRGAFHLLYEKRTALYRGKADLTIHTGGKNPGEILEDIASRGETRYAC
jgi:shikimate kinase